MGVKVTRPQRRKFTLRIPEPLARKIEAHLEHDGRSANAYVLSLIRRDLEGA